ncbi:MAG: protein kinase [Acidobacteria bacterium]|nr:protein kinase [Acidobacteriota bacterium]
MISWAATARMEDKSQQQSVEALCQAALRFAPGARREFLDAACGTEGALRAEVDRLLAMESTPTEGLNPGVPAPPKPGRETGGGGQARRTLGGYQIIGVLGHGGMGEVHLGHDPRLGRRVAIKVLPSHLAADTVARERLRREAMAAAALDHPFICKVFEIGEEDGIAFIAMEYVAGETLADRLRRGRMDAGEALHIAGEVAEALHEAHTARLIHRDLKPSNVMLTTQGHAKVLDFGFATRFGAAETAEGDETASMEPPLTMAGDVVGTPNYMSPEQVRGAELDPRSDVFSLGICLAEMVTGMHPFLGHTRAETMAAILRDPPRFAVERRRDVTPGLLVLIRRMLAKAVEDRYRSMREVLEDMHRLSAISGSETALVLEEAPGIIPLIGRDKERDELFHHLDEAMAGRGALVLIGGEAGIGKTHLARKILAEAGRRGALPVVGHCHEAEGAPPYIPFIEMLEYSARLAPPDALRYAIGDSASEVARLMPELRRMFPDIPPPAELPPEQQRRFLFNAYRDFVDRSSRLTPVVQVFEDLHWADEATVALLEHLAQTVGTIPRLMIGTYREAELDATRPFTAALERLVRRKLVTRIPLKRLPLAGVSEMLRVLSGRQPPHSLPRVIFEATEGNPFFVEEVFRHLSEEGKLLGPDGEWRTGLRVDQLDVPDGVRLVIGRRLERLTGEARQVLTTAAVVGRTFGLQLLEELENTRPDAALDAVEAAERVQLVAAEPGREPPYKFVHELVRQTLAETLTLARRQRLHARIAAAIEKVYAAGLERHTPALAHHLFQSGPAADAARTVEYLTRAAGQASAAAAHEDALIHIENALTLVDDSDWSRAGDLQVRRAVALRSLMRHTEAVDAYERALALFDRGGDALRYGATSIPLGYIHGWALNVTVARGILKRALDRLGDGPSPVRRPILNLSAACASVAGDMDTALSELAAANRLGESPGEPAPNAFLWSCEGHVRYHAFQLDLASAAVDRAMRAFEAAGDPWGRVDGEYVKGFERIFFGRTMQVEALARDAVARAERVGHQYSAWACKTGLVYYYEATGRLVEAEAEARDTLALAESFGCVFRFRNELALANLAVLRGDLAAAQPWFTRAMDPGVLKSAWRGDAESCAAWALASAGDARAGEALDRALALMPRAGQEPAIGQYFGLVRAIEALALLGRHREAAAYLNLVERLAALGAVYTHDMTRTAAGIAAACAGEWQRADEHHRAAIARAAELAYRTPLASARAWYAETLLARGEAGGRDRARVLLDEAARLYAEIGAAESSRKASARAAEA